MISSSLNLSVSGVAEPSSQAAPVAGSVRALVRTVQTLWRGTFAGGRSGCPTDGIGDMFALARRVESTMPNLASDLRSAAKRG